MIVNILSSIEERNKIQLWRPEKGQKEINTDNLNLKIDRDDGNTKSITYSVKPKKMTVTSDENL